MTDENNDNEWNPITWGCIAVIVYIIGLIIIAFVVKGM